jgi:hypothetical protein
MNLSSIIQRRRPIKKIVVKPVNHCRPGCNIMIKCQNTYQLSFIRRIDVLSDLEILYLTFILRCSLSLFKFSFLNYSRMLPPSSLSLELTRYIQCSAFFAKPLPGLDRPRSSISNLSRARYSNVDQSLLDTFYPSELVNVDIKYPYCAIN